MTVCQQGFVYICFLVPFIFDRITGDNFYYSVEKSIFTGNYCKYTYNMYRKARNIAKMGGYTPDGKRITCRNLYMTYSRKGAKKGPGNFLAYVDRAAAEYGPDEPIKRDTRRHMQKIRKTLKS